MKTNTSYTTSLLCNFFCIFCLFSTANIQAGASPDQSEYQALINLGSTYFNFREFNENTRLVSETGWLDSIGVSLNINKNNFKTKLYASRLASEIDYDGRTQSNIPVNSKTDENFLMLGISVHRNITSNLPFDSQWHFGIERHLWNRDIQAVGSITGLDETYEWWLFKTGIENTIQHNKHSVSASASVTHHYQSTVEIDFPGSFDTATLEPGDRWGWHASLNWQYTIDRHWSTGISSHYTRWSLGKSNSEQLTINGVNAGTAFQPRSEAKSAGVNFELIYHWH